MKEQTIFHPRRKVGEGFTFKGLKGNYVMTAALALLVVIGSIVVLNMIQLSTFMRIVSIAFALGGFTVYYLRLVEKSKVDPHAPLKKVCARRRLYYRGTYRKLKTLQDEIV